MSPMPLDLSTFARIVDAMEEVRKHPVTGRQIKRRRPSTAVDDETDDDGDDDGLDDDDEVTSHGGQ